MRRLNEEVLEVRKSIAIIRNLNEQFSELMRLCYIWLRVWAWALSHLMRTVYMYERVVQIMKQNQSIQQTYLSTPILFTTC